MAEETTLLNPKEYVFGDEVLTKQQQTVMMEQALKQREQEKEEALGDTNDSEDDMLDRSFDLYCKLSDYGGEQIIRYAFDKEAQPLYYSDYDQFMHKNAPNCEHCGAKRIFEFQVNNQILMLYPEVLELNWGILAVYSCEKSCETESGFSEEFVQVQQSPERRGRSGN
jgi:pre-rRNA-processing protein TSR4